MGSILLSGALKSFRQAGNVLVVDLTLARDKTSFEDYLRDNKHVNPGFGLMVTVLATGFWPSYKSFDMNLLSAMLNCVEVFKGFYETKTKHIKLTWIYSLGTCNMNDRFEPKSIELCQHIRLLPYFNSTHRKD